MMKNSIAIVGATGMVGRVMLEVLFERGFSADQIYLAASERSAGKSFQFKGHDFTLLSVEQVLKSGIDYALFSAGGDVSRQWAKTFADEGITVIDNSSAWRMDPEVKLIIPEVNGNLLELEDRLIANPNCSTIQLLMVLAPLHELFPIKRVVVSTYQSVTGTGQKAVDQMAFERRGEEGEKIYPHPIDLNLLPHCDFFSEDGYTEEEKKLVRETEKILSTAIPLTATAVRVPVKGGHSESVNVEFEGPFEISDVRAILESAPGIQVCDDPENSVYPMPLLAHNKDEVLVGRIRRDNSQVNSLNLFIVADNLRKGAATNTIQIMEHLIRMRKTVG
jgi:aspartate-semialdehyde dehydrogenase